MSICQWLIEVDKRIVMRKSRTTILKLRVKTGIIYLLFEKPEDHIPGM